MAFSNIIIGEGKNMVKVFTVNDKKYYFDCNSLELYDEIVEGKEEQNICIEKNGLDTVTFLVTNRCNAKCKYCYETPGNKSMTVDAADKALNVLKEKCNKIRKVSFFGGEPLLNVEIIRYIVNQMEELFEIEYFELTTNATLMSLSVIDFLCKHKFKVIISFDGPKNIHDYLREGCDYQKVSGAIRRLQQSAIGNDLEINCTYTQYHEKEIALKDLEDFFEEIGVKYTLGKVITEKEDLKLADEHNYLTIKEDIDRCYESLSRGSKNISMTRYVSAVINAIVNHRYVDKFCEELENGLAFNVDGKAYPCTSLIEKCEMNDYLLANINAKEQKMCKKCWARGICFLCSASIYLQKKDAQLSFTGECIHERMYEYSFMRLLHYYDYAQEKFQNIIDTYYR